MNNYIIILVLLLFSCKSKNDFDRSEYLFRYLKEVQNISLNDKKTLVFIVGNNTCNCTGNSNEIIEDVFMKDYLPKVIILGSVDTILISNLSKKIPNEKIVIDKENKLADYGLTNATNYIFEIENQKIVYWNYLNNETKKSLSEKYKRI